MSDLHDTVDVQFRNDCKPSADLFSDHQLPTLNYLFSSQLLAHRYR